MRAVDGVQAHGAGHRVGGARSGRDRMPGAAGGAGSRGSWPCEAAGATDAHSRTGGGRAVARRAPAGLPGAGTTGRAPARRHAGAPAPRDGDDRGHRRDRGTHEMVIGTFGHAGDGNLHPTIVAAREGRPGGGGSGEGRIRRDHRRGTRPGRDRHRRARGRALKRAGLAGQLGPGRPCDAPRHQDALDPLGMLNPGKAFRSAEATLAGRQGVGDRLDVSRVGAAAATEDGEICGCCARSLHVIAG